MAGDEMKFGEAYVEIHAKLDDYNRELDNFERNTTAAIQEVDRQARTLSETFRDIGQGMAGVAEAGSTVAETGVSIYAKFLLFTRITAIFGAMAVAVKAVGAALALLALPVVVLSGVGYLIKALRELPETIQNIKRWWADVDLGEVFMNATLSIDEFMERIPVLSQLIYGVKQALSFLSEQAGFGHLQDQIEGARESMRLMKLETEAVKDAMQAVGKDSGLGDSTRRNRRASHTSGMDEPDQLRAEMRFEQSDITRDATLHEKYIHEVYAKRHAALREALEAEEMTQEEFDIRLRADTVQKSRDLQKLTEDHYKAIEAATEAGQKRIAEAEQRTSMQRRMEIHELQSQIVDMRVALEMSGADAQAEAIRQGYALQIEQAEVDGNEHRMRLLQELSNLRIEQVRRMEQERFDAQRDEIRNGMRSMIDEMTRFEIEAQNDKLGLELFDIDATTDQRIDDLKNKLSELHDQRVEMLRDGGYDQPLIAVNEDIQRVEQMIDALERLREKRKEAAMEEDAEKKQRMLEDVQSKNRQLQFEIDGRRDLAELEGIEHRYAKQIADARQDGNEELAKALELQRDLQRELAGQAASGDFRQIDMRELNFESPLKQTSSDQKDNPTMKEIASYSKQQLAEAKAMREAIERGIPTILG